MVRGPISFAAVTLAVSILYSCGLIRAKGSQTVVGGGGGNRSVAPANPEIETAVETVLRIPNPKL